MTGFWWVFGYVVGLTVGYLTSRYDIRDAVRKVNTTYMGFWYGNDRLNVNVYSTLESLKADPKVTSWITVVNTGKDNHAPTSVTVSCIDGKVALS